MFGGNFAPAGWAFCDGSLMAISENDALFALIGTTYGGDGQSTFGLPDLRGRLPVHQGTGPDGQTHVMGQVAGDETVTLTTQQLPAHTHALTAAFQGANQTNPANHLLARSNLVDAYINRAPDIGMSGQAIEATGGSQPHENLQPFLPISFIISLFGIFPSQT
jgi:microcystin-dependent protein